METATSTWRTYTGAEYTTAAAIPCLVIANGYLIDDYADPIHEDHPVLLAEINRRGWDVYRDHGYGAYRGRELVLVVGCNHEDDDPLAADHAREDAEDAAKDAPVNPIYLT